MRGLPIITMLLFWATIQTGSAQNFKGELFAGAVGSQVSGDELSGFNKGGIAIGAGVRLDLNEKSSIGFRIGYLQKGSRKPSAATDLAPTFYLMRLHYIEMPILYRYRLGNKLYFEAGPSLGYLFGAYEEDQDGEMAYIRLSVRQKLGFSIWGHPIYSSDKGTWRGINLQTKQRTIQYCYYF